MVATVAGVVQKAPDGRLQLDSLLLVKRLVGVTSPLHTGAGLVKGQVLGEVDGPLRVQLCRGVQLNPPLFCTPSRAPAWQALCPSPAVLLGLACDAEPEIDPQLLLARREASFARSDRKSTRLNTSH